MNPFGIGFNPFAFMPAQAVPYKLTDYTQSADGFPTYFQPQDGASFSPGAVAQSPMSYNLWSAYGRLLNMQKEHGVQQFQWLEQAAGRIEDKKTSIFDNNHYELDDKGSLVFDDKGLPKLVSGEETKDQKKTRESWEKAEKEKVTGKYQEDSNAMVLKLRQLQQEQMTNPALMRDPKYMTDYVKRYNNLKAQSQGLDDTYNVNLAKAGIGHLPDPDNPEGTMGGYIDKTAADFKALRARHQQEEMSSPEGIAVASVMNQYSGYVDSLKQYYV